MRGRRTAPRSNPLRWRQITRNDQFVLAILAAVIGTVVAYGAIGFREFLAFVQNIGFGFSGEDVFTQVGRLPWWQVILVPTIGGLLIGVFVHFFMPGRRPQGVANVIEADALHGGRMSLTLGLRAAVVNAASLGVGASAGRDALEVGEGQATNEFAVLAGDDEVAVGRGLDPLMMKSTIWSRRVTLPAPKHPCSTRPTPWKAH